MEAPENNVRDSRTRLTNCHLHVLGIRCRVRQDKWQEQLHVRSCLIHERRGRFDLNPKGDVMPLDPWTSLT